MNVTRIPWWFVALVALAMTFGSFQLLHFRQKRLAWDAALTRHADCQSLVEQIRRLESVPRFAVLNADSPQAISARIEQTAQFTLPVGALLAIQPESGRRVGNTSYMVHPTLIQLQNVTLAQLASFAAGLEDAEQGLVVSELRLLEARTNAGDDSSANERWTSDLKLTQTIYSANVSRP